MNPLLSSRSVATDLTVRFIREFKWSKIRKVNRNTGKQVSKAGEEGSDDKWEYASIPGNSASENNMESVMDVKIKEFPTYHIAYMRHVGPYGKELSSLWKKFEKWVAPRMDWPKEAICLGISHDDPRVTAPEKCRYDACVVVPKDFKADSQVNVADLPGGKYAIMRFVGTAQEIGSAWDGFWSHWLPDSGFQPDNRPSFEFYNGAEIEIKPNNPKDPKFKCDLCIPVKPL